MRKTKVMMDKNRVVQAENMGKFPCGICKKGVGVNSYQLMDVRNVAVLGETTYGYRCRRRCVGGDSGIYRYNITIIPFASIQQYSNLNYNVRSKLVIPYHVIN